MTTWYVRPIGAEYGAEDGTTYETAFDGFAGITWGVGGVVAGDTLYVCGTHSEEMIVGASGSSGSYITIRGDYPTDPGIIDDSVAGALTRALTTNGEDYIYITALTVSNIDTGASDGHGIYINQSTGCKVTNCTCAGCYWDGVRVADSTDTIIQNNTITGNAVRGIIAFTSAGADTAIRRTQILNNTITGNGRWGISLDSNNTTQRNDAATGYVISNNTIHGNGGGILLEDTGGAVISYNMIGDNLLSGEGGESGEVFGINSSRNIYIERNEIQLTTDTSYVVYMDVTSGGISPSTNINLLGNTCDATPGVVTQNGAIFFGALTNDYATGVLIAGNKVGHGQGLYSRDNGLTVINNIFHNCRFFSRLNLNAFTNGLTIKNNVFENDNAGGQVSPPAQNVLQLISGGTVVLDGNVYIATFGSGALVSVTGGSTYTAANITDIDANGSVVDPAFDADFNVTTASLLINGVNTNTPVAIGIDGEPFPSINVSRGSTQATDADNHPFHPVNL